MLNKKIVIVNCEWTDCELNIEREREKVIDLWWGHARARETYIVTNVEIFSNSQWETERDKVIKSMWDSKTNRERLNTKQAAYNVVFVMKKNYI